MDSAYRYGGEEFTVILPETSGEEAEVVAQRIRQAIEEEEFKPLKSKAVPVTVSIGVTQYCSNEEVFALIQRSDIAMYSSKESGRNKVSCLFVENASSQ